MTFINSSRTVITGENTFNYVQGNQVNGTINAGTVNFITGQAVVKRTKYDQFREVICGDAIMLKEIHSEEITDREWQRKYRRVVEKHKARKTICTVEVYPDQQSKFTALMYKGEDAEWFWEKQFEKISHAKYASLYRP
ncbi:hypothetical protein Moror_10881 [Moniliophthora roreri MCA 2997]|uniref:Uncharacterized protein n=2 Tax=Moniliophthora roreri TaxID=221103 RepID=V2X2B8_MONRO|nr:hypothetical protein Moror_10881 [Moniliophthora roreri MCA 2997]